MAAGPLGAAPGLALGWPWGRPDSKSSDFAETVAYFNEFWVPPCAPQVLPPTCWVLGRRRYRQPLYNRPLRSSTYCQRLRSCDLRSNSICDSLPSIQHQRTLRVSGRIESASRTPPHSCCEEFCLTEAVFDRISFEVSLRRCLANAKRHAKINSKC